MQRQSGSRHETRILQKVRKGRYFRLLQMFTVFLAFSLYHGERDKANFPRLNRWLFHFRRRFKPRFCFSVNSLNKLSFEVRTMGL